MENVRQSDIQPAARKEILEKTSDGNVTFREFQDWLVRATKVDPDTKNTFSATHYHKSIGSNKEMLMTKKKAEPDHSWNKHTMSQNLRRMQYAVRGEVVIKADASKFIIPS